MTLLNEPKPCSINGTEFVSIADASRHFGVTPQAISYLVKHKGSVVTGYVPVKTTKPVTIDGKQYKSKASAARMLKISYGKLCAMLRNDPVKATIDRSEGI